MVEYSTLVGRVVSHYRIIEKIGAGGMGEVYRAHDERLERDVALKVLHPGLLSSEADRKRFRKEALALSKLNHPNIATIHDFDTQEGLDFLIMEYVAGETLTEKLHGGSLPEKDVARLGMQLAEGLVAAHEQGIVHRDLKPGNTRLTIDGRLKILDFGLAKLAESPGATTKSALTASTYEPWGLLGTLPYMAPEQLRGEQVDGRTDIWSAGVLLYKMATGRPAFPQSDSATLLTSILTTAPVAPREVNQHLSSGVENIILKCLEKDRDDRYQSAKDLAVDLRRLLTPSPVTHLVSKQRFGIGNKISLAAASSVAALLALILGLNSGGVRDKLLGGRAHTPIRSLVVLPLANLSGDSEQDYFADGMTEALITDLSKIRGLKVISPTSAMRYKEEKKTLPQFARELGVDGVVRGSVVRADSRVRISAQLIYATSDQYLWAESYERDFKDILVLQSEVAQAIANEIRIELTPQDRARLANTPPVSAEAYQLYLKGRFFWNKATEEDYTVAKRYFDRALEIDPKYALAYSGLADYFWATDALSPQVAMPRAKDYALKALAIDDTLSDAHTTLANVKFNADWDWQGAEKEFRRAIELNPSDAEARRSYSVFLSAMGRSEEALIEIQNAQRLDPLSLAKSSDVGWALYFARRYDQAIEQCQATLELDPNSVGAHDCLGSAYLAKGNYGKAIDECQKAASGSRNDPVRVAGLGRAYAFAGKTAKARDVLGKLYSESKRRYIPPYFLATIYAALGEKEEAFAWLEKAYNVRDTNLTWLKVDDGVDSLRSDARFRELLSRIGFPQ
jgi:TolB-like protein/Tfp pilus assembly protein PilF/predicted Ser/Thr protein kinase